MSNADTIRAALERGMSRYEAGEISLADVVAEGVRAALKWRDALTPAEREAVEREELLAAYDRLGADRWAAGRVAQSFSGGDAKARKRIAQRVRALVRKREAKRSLCA